MRPKPKRNESGQILILLALALVGLLGFTALAIDGSMVYTDRRYDQSAADSASLAGAQAAAYSLRLTFVNDVPNHDQGSYETFSCTSDWVQTAMDAVFNAVRDRAATNNFTLSLSDRYYTLADLENAKYGLYVECRDQPPVTASDLDKGIYVHVMLTNTVSTSLVHFVFGGPIRNTVTAVARADPARPFAYGADIVALRTDCPNNSTGGVQFQGNETVNVNGGDIFSNFCLFKNGSSIVNVTNGTIEYNDQATYQHPGNPDCGIAGANISPCPTPTSDQLSFNTIPTPDCNALTDLTWSGNNPPGSGKDIVLSPGIYTKDPSISGNQTLTLQPGLYCFYNGLTISGTNPTLTGSGVTIVMMGGGMKVAGGVTVTLSAPAQNASLPAIPGLLIYQPASNTSDLQLGGNTTSTMSGTIFAPSAVITFSGTSTVGSCFDLQIIGDTVIVNGTPNVCINYDKKNDFFIWPSVDLSR
jgi:hypothetical protein